MNFGLEAKVGIFVVGCLMLISAMSLRLVDFSLSDDAGMHIQAELQDAAGLTKDAPVIFKGVEVGKVKSLELINGRAIADILIDEEYELPSNLNVLIRSKGFLGEKYAELKVTENEPAGKLAKGVMLKSGEKGTDFDELGDKIGSVADDVKAITSSLRKVLATQQAEENMTATLSNVREITDSVNMLVQQNEKRIDMIIRNMETLTGTLSEVTVANANNINNIVANINSITNDLKAQTPLISENLRIVTDSLREDGPTIAKNFRNISDDVDDVMSSQKENLKKAISNIAVVTTKLETTVDNLNDITGKISEGKGTIGKLVNEEETVDNLNGALTGLKDTLGAIDKFKVDLAFSAERYGETENGKGHVKLKVTPGKKRYYLVGLTSDQDGTTKESISTVDTDYSSGTDEAGQTSFAYTENKKVQNPDSLLWTLMYAHRFYDDFFFRVGLLESDAGVGLDYHPFDGEQEQKLVFNVDAFDMPDSDEDRELHMRAGVKYKFYKNLFVTGGYDDFLNSDTDSWFVGAGVEFRDDDLKYLMGKTPLPTN